MNFDLLKKIPLLAKETKEKFSKALTTFQLEESSYFFNESFTKDQLLEFLNSKYNPEILIALKKIIALFLLGKEVSNYIPKIIQKLPIEDNEIKRLCQYLLCQLSCNEFQKDTLLMCIQPLHKEILSQQIILRGDSFRTLSSLNLEETTPIISQTINKIIIDKSAYVRKIACFSLYKILKNETLQDKSEIEHFLKYLMKDICYVKGSSLVVFCLRNSYSNYGFLHPYFRKICKELPQFSSFDLVYVLDLMHKYCKIFFNEEKQQKNQDFELFLNSCEKLLKSMHSDVIIEIGNIFIDFPSEDRITKLTKSLIRFLNLSSETKLIILQMLRQMSARFPNILKPFYRSFFIINLEKFYCKLIKIEILYNLCDETNMSKILDELSYYCRSSHPEISCCGIETVGKLALKSFKFLPKCTKILLNLFKNETLSEIDEVVLALTRIITHNLKENVYILIYCLKIVPSIKNPKPRSNIISLICEIVESIPTLATEFLRTLLLNFSKETLDLKLQIINLNLQLLLSMKTQKYMPFLFKSFIYLLQLSDFDPEIALRDRARFLKNLLITYSENPLTLMKSEEIYQNIFNYSDEFFGSFLKNLHEKKLVLKQDFLMNTSLLNKIKFLDEEFINRYRIGSLSNLIGFKVRGYREMPQEKDFSNENTEKLRDFEEIISIKKTEMKENEVSKVENEEKEEKEKDSNKKSVKKQSSQETKVKIETEQITSHFQNLNQALNDFFSSEEEESENEENK